MQVIGATFAAYRNPSLSSNIYDPLANIYAGLNYAVHRYGNPGWLSVLGHGHGYALGGMVPGGESYGMYGNGGMINEPVIGYGVNSGKGYVLGESGREQVTPASEVQRQASLQSAMLTELRQQTQVLKQIPAGVGQHVGGALNGAAHSASFSARYPHQGW
jgi:SLT domain-containing protein